MEQLDQESDPFLREAGGKVDEEEDSDEDMVDVRGMTQIRYSKALARNKRFSLKHCFLLVVLFSIAALIFSIGLVVGRWAVPYYANTSPRPLPTSPTTTKQPTSSTPTSTTQPPSSSISFHVSPQLLEKSGQWVTVKWSSVPNPTSTDWIGVYSPPTNLTTIDPLKQAPIKYQNATFSPDHLSHGQGALNFTLVNMRSNVVLGFFRGNTSAPVLLAVSEVVRFKNPNEPLQGHLALTEDPTEMILMWVTRDSASPQVKWGTQSGDYSRTKQANSSTYSAKDMCGLYATGVGYIDPGTLHQVTMDSLLPGGVYYYRFGDSENGWSEEFKFRAPPSRGPEVAVRIIAYGDMGRGFIDGSEHVYTRQQPSLNTTARVMSELNNTDVVLHIGDISYAEGYASVWDEFFDQIQPIATRVPYMVCIGNHEGDFPNSASYYTGVDSGGECSVPYERRLSMPRPSIDQPWYGFDYGCVHIVMMSTEHDFRVNSTQFNFLSQHLMNVNRSKTPWLVFAGHRPMYIDSIEEGYAGENPVAKELRDNLEPLLKDHEVDLALWGHSHCYQRTCPVYQEVCTQRAPVHLVIGMAGEMLSQDFRPTPPPWIQYRDNKHWGYSRIKANSSSLVFEYVTNDDGQVHDRLVLNKSPVSSNMNFFNVQF